MPRSVWIFMILTTMMTVCIPSSSHAADYYWVGGSGDWSDINHWATTSGGSVTHFTVPSPYDDVYFDQNSFTGTGQTVNMNLNIITCRDLDCSQIQFSPTFSSNSNTTIEIYGSVQLIEDMDFLANSDVHFLSDAPGNTIKLSGQLMLRDVYFNGSGGGWTLQDSLVLSSGSIHFKEGALNTNDQLIRCTQFNSNYAFPRDLELGSSVIYVYSFWTVDKSGLSLDAGTSHIIIGSNNGKFISTGAGSVAYHDLSFSGTSSTSVLNTINISFNRVTINNNGNIFGNITYGDLVLTRGMTYSFSSQTTHTFLDSLVAEGYCLQPIRLRSFSGTTIFSKSSGSISVEYCEIKDIHATGGAAFYAIASEDLGNTNGWQFTPPASRTLYWVDGNGNWSDTTNWSLSSGGPSGICPPTHLDDVVFDDSSFPGGADTVFLNQSHSYCRDMTWMAYGSSPAFIGNSGKVMHIYGSLQFQPVMDTVFSGPLYFEAYTPGHTVEMAGQELTQLVEFRGDGGGWTLLDDLTVNGQNVELTYGHLNTGGNTIDCFYFVSEEANARELTLGSSKIITRGSGGGFDVNINGTNLMLNAGTSEFILTGGNPVFKVGNGGQLIFHNVLFEAEIGTASFRKDGTSFNRVRFNSDGSIIGNTTIDSLWLTRENIYRIEVNTTQTLGHLIADGYCHDPIFLETDALGGVAVFDGAVDTSKVYNIILQDIHCLPGTNFFAYNTVDLGNTDGWHIQERQGKDFYWINGTGQWSDTAHWSYTSGGSSVTCIPSPVDNVIFDSNSFIIPSDTVLAALKLITCHDMRWVHDADTFMFIAGDSVAARIYGSLLLSPRMDYRFEGPINFLADTTDKTITSAGNVFLNNLFFRNGRGGWTLTDSLSMNCNNCRLDLITGSLWAQGRKLNITDFRSDKLLPKSLDIRHARIEISRGNWLLNADTNLFMGDSSIIRFTSNIGNFVHSSVDTAIYWDVHFEDSNTFYQLSSGSSPCRFNLVTFNSSASISGDNFYDSLVFVAGGSYMLENAKTQYLNTLIAEGNCFEEISILSQDANQQSVIHKDADTLAINYVNLQGIDGQGGAYFLASNSRDLGNNTNWTIEEVLPREKYWVNGSGDWHDSGHWSYSSGGPPGACIPTRFDNVYFDQNSFIGNQDSVNIIKAAAECRNMDWTGSTGRPHIMGLFSLNIYGSLYLTDSLQNELNRPWYFRSDSLGEELMTFGIAFPASVFFNGNGSWNLLDTLRVVQDLNFIKGTLRTNDHDIYCAVFDSDHDETRSLYLGESEITINSSAQFGWVMDGTNMFLDAGTSLIRFLMPSGMDNQTGNDLDYHNVRFENPAGNTLLRTSQMECSFNHMIIRNGARIFGKNTFDSLTFFPDNTYRLDINNPQTIIDYFWVRGNNCFPVRLESMSEGAQAEIVKASGDVTGDFIHMRDISATGGATFYAGANSADIDNNSGWIFNNAPSYVYGLPDDTFLLKGTPFVISTVNFNGGPSTSYLWDDGSTGSSLTVTTPGTYYVTVSYDENCIVLDSIEISCRLQMDFDTVPTTCNAYSDGSIDLEIGGDPYPYDYLWSTGDTVEDISGLSAGWYTVTVTDSICYGIDSVRVTEPPLPDAHLNDTAFCEDTSVTITAKPGFMEYQWYDGSTGPQITLNQGDSIWLIVVDSNGCVSVKFEAYVKEDPLPLPELGLDSCVTFDGNLLLDPGSFEDYLWQDGSGEREFLVRQEGQYWVKVKQASCYASDTIFIDACPPEITIPNVFTPNSDGYNDVFKPEAVNIVFYRVVIFNRWGAVVFESNDIHKGWNGRSNGMDCSEGTYYYTIEYAAYLNEEKRNTTQGSITLLR